MFFSFDASRRADFMQEEHTLMYGHVHIYLSKSICLSACVSIYLSYPILSYPIPYPILSYPTDPILSNPILSHPSI